MPALVRSINNGYAPGNVKLVTCRRFFLHFSVFPCDFLPSGLLSPLYQVYLLSASPFDDFFIFYQLYLLPVMPISYACYSPCHSHAIYQLYLLPARVSFLLVCTHLAVPWSWSWSLPGPSHTLPPLAARPGSVVTPPTTLKNKKGQKAFQPCSSFFVSFLPRPPTKTTSSLYRRYFYRRILFFSINILVQTTNFLYNVLRAYASATSYIFLPPFSLWPLVPGAILFCLKKWPAKKIIKNLLTYRRMLI